MPNPAGTYAARLAWAQARLGKSRKDPEGRDWTPRTDVDDCALFMSAVVFGARSYAAWNVDVFKTLTGGTYHAGRAGIRPGDVLLFDWDGNGVGNHIEMATAAPTGQDVHTIGANGSGTIAVANRLQPLRYVMGYFRPAWPSSPTPTPDPPQEDTMKFNATILGTDKGQMLDIGGSVYTLDSTAEVKALNEQNVPVLYLHPDTYQRVRKHALR